MTTSDWINASLAVASYILAVISIWAVKKTIKQNNQMLENSNRPYIAAMYEMVVLPDDEIARYIVIKNFGHSSGTLLDVQIDGVLSEQTNRQICLLRGATIAPGQKFWYYFAPANDQTPELLSIKLIYISPEGKTYAEASQLKMVIGTNKKRALKPQAIPLILQDMADRLL